MAATPERSGGATGLIRGYATALFQIADAEGALERVSDELFTFAKAVEQNNDLRSALTDIALPTERKQAVIDEILGERALPQTKHILEFVISQGRGRELSDIVNSLSELAAEARNSVLAEVRTAVDLDEDQRKRLAESLAKATGKRVDVKIVIDPAVVGGIYAKVGDQVIDATIRRRLQELQEQLARTGD